jgi:hypothetical protein
MSDGVNVPLLVLEQVQPCSTPLSRCSALVVIVVAWPWKKRRTSCTIFKCDAPKSDVSASACQFYATYRMMYTNHLRANSLYLVWQPFTSSRSLRESKDNMPCGAMYDNRTRADADQPAWLLAKDMLKPIPSAATGDAPYLKHPLLLAESTLVLKSEVSTSSRAVALQLTRNSDLDCAVDYPVRSISAHTLTVARESLLSVRCDSVRTSVPTGRLPLRNVASVSCCIDPARRSRSNGLIQPRTRCHCMIFVLRHRGIKRNRKCIEVSNSAE